MKSKTVLSACYVKGVPHEIAVTATVRPGLPHFQIIGLPDRLVREAVVRVRSALLASGLSFPKGRVVISLTPAELPKAGTQLDFAMAAAILAATSAIPEGSRYLGEVLPGGGVVLRPQHYGLHRLGDRVGANQHGFSAVYHSLNDLVAGKVSQGLLPSLLALKTVYMLDTISGLHTEKRALAIALAGKHSVLLSGAAGTGKTLLAEACAELMPPHSPESLQNAAVWRGRSGVDTNFTRAFVIPTVGVSAAKLLGSASGQVGQLALAVGGMTFLDEISLYPQECLSALRKPLEDGYVVLHTEVGELCYPMPEVVFAATNTCLCGNYGVNGRVCSCTAYQIAQFRARMSEPLLERFAVHIDIPPEILVSQATREAAEIARKVAKVWDSPEVLIWSDLAKQALVKAAQHYRLSPRVQKHAFAIAETICRYDGKHRVEPEMVLEALQYRPRTPGTNLL